MRCPACNAQLEGQARFCGVCGHKLTAAEVAAGGGGGRAASTPAPGRATAARAIAEARDPYVGTLLNNRFLIEDKLGEGGFGAVYKGTQQGINRRVALKLLHPEMARDHNLVARFRREGLVMCNLRDAHTITTYDFDQTPDGTLYIAMELLEGRSLHEVFHAEAPIEWRRMLKIASEMCSSLAEAHQQGIVHRDLKPENVYLENRPGNPEFVKILDFGIAKVVQGDGPDPGSPQLTATGQTLGTLEYMSPEQLMGKKLDGRSDIYAVGVVAYELITGRLPFPDAKGPAGLITAQLRQTPDPPSVAHPAGGIPPGVDAIIARCLQKDKKKRFADVGELRTAIETTLSSGGQWVDPRARAATPRPATPPPQMRPPGSAPAPLPVPPGSAPAPHPARPGSAPAPYPAPPGSAPAPHPQGQYAGPGQGYAQPPGSAPMPMPPQQPYGHPGHPGHPGQPMQPYGGPSTQQALRAARGGNSKMMWAIVLGVLAVGGIVGTILAFTI